MKKYFWKRVLSCLTAISLLVNSLLPYSVASFTYAQELTETVPSNLTETLTQVTTPEPTIEPDPTETITPTPTDVPSPIPTDIFSPTPSINPSTTMTPTAAPEPTLEPTPEATPSATPEATPSATPTVEPTPNTEPASLSDVKIPLREAGNFLKDVGKQTNKNYVEGEVIVKFKTNKLNVKSAFGKAQAFVFEKKFSLEKKDEIKASNIQVFKSKKSTEEMVRELKSDPNVEYVQPNYIYEPTVINTSDTFKDLLWGLDSSSDKDIDVPEAWEISEGNGTIVAIIDSGVAYNHPDLINSMWNGSSCKDENGNTLGGCNSGFDYEDGDKSPLPTTMSHGTHIAGTIAAVKNNAKGIIGVAPQTKIMAIKTNFSSSQNIKAINFAKQNGAKIINASWGCYGGDQGGTHAVCGTPDYDDFAMIDAISGFDGLFIAAAGNGDGDSDFIGDSHDSGQTLHSYPCDHTSDNIICVAATDQNDDLADFSDYGVTSVDVGAPGVDIYSTGFAGENFLNATLPGFTNTIFTKTSGGWKTGTWGDFGGNASDKNAQANTSYVDDDTSILTLTVPMEEAVLGEDVLLNFYLYLSTEPPADVCFDYLSIETDNNDENWEERSYGCGDLEGDYSTNLGPAISDMRVRFVWYTDGSVIGTQVPVIDDIEFTNTLSYQYMNGTSMAAPHVAGLAALIEGYNSGLTPAQVKDIILNSGDTATDLVGKTVTGKRINAFKALQAANFSKAITSFTLPGQVGVTVIDESAHTIDINVPFGTNVTALTPTIIIIGSSVSPASGVAQDFTGPVTYTVTAEDSSTQEYVVTVTIGADPIAAAFDTISAGLVSELNVANNLNDVTSANIGSFSGLYFTKYIGGNPVSKLTFSGSLDLSDSETQTFLQNLGDSLDQSNGRIALDVSTAAALAGKGAILEMYGITSASESNLIVRDDDGHIIDASGIVSNFSYDPDTDIVTFDASHFTQFDIDTTPPVIAAHTNLSSVEATSGSGAVVSYTSPIATDNIDPTSPASCTPTSGSTFSVGTTTITCTKTDTAGNSATSTTFTASVVDTTPPAISSHEDVTISATSASGAVVTYTPPLTTDIVDGSVAASCIPTSGSTFAIGTTTVTCTKTDVAGNSAAPTTFTVTVQENPPVLDSIGDKSVDELTNLNFTATASDVDSSSLTFSLSNAPTGATIDPDTGVFSFTPTEEQGPNDFTFSVNVSDGNNTDWEEITVTVNEVNVDPVAHDSSATVLEDTAKDITLTATDPDVPVQTLTYSIIDNPNHGSVSLVNDLATYTPDTDYNGSDSFTFQVSDSSSGTLTSTSLNSLQNTVFSRNSSLFNPFLTNSFSYASVVTSDIATISLTIDPVNDAPIANPDTASVDEDNDLVIAKTTLLSNDTDTENDSLTLTVVSNPNNGTVLINGDNVVFTPTTNYFGSASFDYTISDGALTNTSTVNITVNSINDAPSFDAIADQPVNEDSPSQDVAITNVSSGPENESSQTVTLSATSSNTSIVPNPSLSGSGETRTLTYTPDSNKYGAVTITVIADDEQGLNNTFSRTFTITVNSINDEPIANSDTADVDEDQILTIAKSTLLANDTDVENDTLTLTTVSNPVNGSVVIDGTDVKFTPTTNYFGSASFDYTVSDGNLTNSATVTVTVNPVNDAPELDQIGDKDVDEFSTLSFTVSATDVDNASLDYITSSLPTNATFNGDNQTFTFIPDESQGGQDYQVTFTVSDGSLTDDEVITITVNEVNSSPVAIDDTASVNEDGVIIIDTGTLLTNDYDLDTNTNAGLTVTAVNTAINGIVGIEGLTITFTSNTNFNGSASFDYIVSDGSLTDTGTVNITVNPINDTPVLDAIGNKNVNEYDTLDFTVNATDVDNSSLNLSATNIPTNATFNTETGAFSFTPDESQGGQDYQVTFNVSDGSLVDSEIITITVNEVNNAPVAQDNEFTTNEDSAIAISYTSLLANDNDPDNTLDELSITEVSNPINGTVIISGNDVIFTPTLNYFGPASFEYTVSDGYLTDIATVNVTVDPINDQPVAENGVATTDEDTLVTINLSASDVDNGSLTYSVVSGVSHGVLNNLTNNKIDYTPSADYFGTDSFTFKANDGSINSNVATVTITVTAVNDSPILDLVGNRSVNESITLSFTVTATDPDNTLIYSLSNEPTGATINSNTGEFSFTPTEVQGPNSYTLTFNVTDGTNTDSEEITITVNEVNVAPVATDNSVSTNEDTAKTITLGATDSDLPINALTYFVVSGVSNGVLGTIVNNQLTYTPSTDYNGVDSFTFKANDGTTDSNTATISITINPVNDAPIANPDTATVSEDTDLIIAKSTLLSNDTDVENNTLTVIAISNYINGNVIIDGDNVVFTPTTNYFGSASFDYTISDGALTSTSTVNITVNPINDAPVANNGSQTTNEDTLVTIDLSGSDIEGDSLAYSIVSGVSNGVLGDISGNQVSYTPNANYNGSDSFTFNVNDGGLDSNTATISITINAVNDAPVLNYIGNKSVDELATLSFTVTATDPDSSLTYSLINKPTGSTIDPNTGVFSFTPTESQGPNIYTLTVGVTDGTETDSEEITITVSEVNMDPVALDGNVLTDEDTVVEITLNATDSDVPTNTLTYSIVSGVSHGVLGTISGNQLTYTPSADYNGIDSFTFKANDGTADSNTATFILNINPVNDKPVATSDTASINEDTVLTIAKTTLLSNDTDIDGDLLTLSSVSNPVNGSVVIDGTSVKFTPTTNYFGSASFNYIVTDGTLTDNTLVTITVNSVNDSPIANDSTVIASQDTSVTIDLSVNDIEGDLLTYSINTGVSHGTLGAVVGNQVVYTPGTGYVGSDSFTFLANDGNIDSNVATIDITVNLPPVISEETTNTPEETSITITWTTDHSSTSRVIYDTVSHTILDVAPNYGYANSTIEADNSPKVTSHTVTINGLTAGITYFYRVVSHGSPEVVGDEKSFTTKSVTTSGGGVAGTSTSSSSSPVCNDQKPGSAPTLISVVSYGPNEVTLTWTKANDPVTYYLVTFGTKSGEMLYGNPSVGGSNTTSYTVRGLSAGSRYYFKVRAGNNCMTGDFSNELSTGVYGELLAEIPEGFSPGVLGEDTTTEEVLGDEAPVSQPQAIKGLLGGSTLRNIILSGLGIILISAGYFFFIRRKKV